MKKGTRTWGYILLLISRTLLFLLFQVIIALVANSWQESQKYWLLTATLTNICSISLLVWLFRREGISFLSQFKISRTSLKKDIRLFIGLVLLAGPVAMGPGYLLSHLLWSDPDIPTHLMFSPLPGGLMYVLLVAFPVSIAFAELATYFVYLMPRLKATLKKPWLAVVLPVLFLSIQHCTLPFIPDINFIIYRGLVFLPFAALVGITIYFRPSLFPYFAVLHGLMDLGTGFMFLYQ